MHASYDYAIIRVVPRVEREEFVNVGVIVACQDSDFLDARIELDEARLLALAPDVDLAAVREHLAAIPRLCAGGAAAGALAAYVVLPTRGRLAAADNVGDVLDDVAELLSRVSTVLTSPADQRQLLALLEQARTLRGAMDTLRTTARPLTGQVASLTNRTGLRRVVLVVGACEHHARALARGAADATGLAASPGRRQTVCDAVSAVARTLDTVRPAFDPDGPGTAPVPPSVDDQLEAMRRLCDDAEDPGRDLLWSMLRHLRAIDGALRGLARELPDPVEGDQGPEATTRAGGAPGSSDERAVASPQQ
jgi:hypothetical protein